MDNLTPEQRKKNMRHIKAKDTAIEVRLRKELWKRGYRYRKNFKDLPGKPDIVLTKQKIAIFCDGEFFHGKNWEVLKPKLKESNNGEYWITKIGKNIAHDDEVNKCRRPGFPAVRVVFPGQVGPSYTASVPSQLDLSIMTV